MTLKTDQEEDPGNIIGTVEIQDELGTLDISNQQSFRNKGNYNMRDFRLLLRSR